MIKTLKLIVFLSCCTILSFAQDNLKRYTLNVDLDRDLKLDVVVFNKQKGVIIVKLSTQKFRPIETGVFSFDPVMAGLKLTRNGFGYFNDWMRAGYSCQFKYDTVAKQVKLIGMTNYEFGPANNNGSGESSLNLSTNKYIGNWNYWDDNEDKLIAIPTLKQNMTLPQIYLSDFSDDVIADYQKRCSKLYYEARDRILKAKKDRD